MKGTEWWFMIRGFGQRQEESETEWVGFRSHSSGWSSKYFLPDSLSKFPGSGKLLFTKWSPEAFHDS
nr:MAG: hypothetical protein AM324_02480 [Candidatus Thorarchaeota archaeon SMTZ1-83]